MEFKESTIPTTSRSGRTPLPNPFTEAFPADEKALSFVVEQGRDSVEARRAVRQVRQAARSIGRTGRIAMTDLPDGSVEFTVWTVEKITRSTAKAAAPAKATARKK